MKGVYRRACALSKQHGLDSSYGHPGLKKDWVAIVESVVHEMAHGELLGLPLLQTRPTAADPHRSHIDREINRRFDDHRADLHEALTLAAETYALCELRVPGVPMEEIALAANFRIDRDPNWILDAYRASLRNPRARRAAAAIVQTFAATDPA